MKLVSVALIGVTGLVFDTQAQVPPEFEVHLRTIIGGSMQWIGSDDPGWSPPQDPAWIAFTETSPGSNRWIVRLPSNSPANDAGNTWTITGLGDPLPSIESFEQERLINGDPVSVIISGTTEITFNLAATSPLLDNGCDNFGGLVGANTSKIQLIVVAEGAVSGDIECRRIGRLEAGGSLSADIVTTDASAPIEMVRTDGQFSGSLETAGTSLKSFVSGSYTGDLDLSGDLGRFDV